MALRAAVADAAGRKVPNLDDAGFVRIAREAEQNCPVSKVLKAAITLDAKLV